MKVGSLFSGGGLGDFGFLAAGMEIKWQCEIDEYCQKILQLRYPESIKYTDIKELKGNEIEKVDIITGGFPCQPFSVAGKQKGKEDDRYLWPEMLRVIKEHKPSWIVGENVPGIINLALDTVCSDLERESYEVWPIVFPSHALGAWHKRDRLWIICHAKYDGQSSCKKSGSIKTRSSSSETREIQTSESERSGKQYAPLADPPNTRIEGVYKREDSTTENVVNSGLFRQKINEEQSVGLEQCGKVMANTTSDGCEQGTNFTGEKCKEIGRDKSSICGKALETKWRKYWESEPSVGRVANGITNRVQRLKMLGNGQVSACTYVIGRMIMELENEKYY